MAKEIKSANEGIETNKAKIEMFEMFSEREHEVLQQMAYGLKNEEISNVLHISESTVKTHVHRILQKIGAEDRTQAVVYAIRNRIVLLS
ncbi:DNA-binding NarL/FixJ family response regulator [Lysinibacillus sp. RC79]